MSNQELKIIVDGNEHTCKERLSVNDFLRSIGINIPTACYVENKTDGGRCMVCAVDIDNEIKPSCCTQIENGMEIKTTTLDAVRARNWAIRFLLAHHPPLCHSCNKLGDCVLPKVQTDAGQGFHFKFKNMPYKSQPLEIAHKILFDESKCIYCGLCDKKSDINIETVKACPTGALEQME